MDFPTLTITHEPKSKGRIVKSRCFHSTLLTYLTADRLWALGQAGYAGRHRAHAVPTSRNRFLYLDTWFPHLGTRPRASYI